MLTQTELKKFAKKIADRIHSKTKTELMKKNLPLIVIIASAILMIGNFITTEEIDRGFWVSTLSSVLIIISMVLTIRDNKNKDKN